jgi:hypothetical protein
MGFLDLIGDVEFATARNTEGRRQRRPSFLAGLI